MMLENMLTVFVFISKVALLRVDHNYHREFFIKGLALSAVSMLKSKPKLQTWIFCIKHIRNKVNLGLLGPHFFSKKRLTACNRGC